MQADAKVKEIVDEFLGAPYRHGGRGPLGLDCYGLIIKVYKRLGVELFDVESYPLNWPSEKNLFLENYHRQWKKIESPNLFDVVLLCSKTGRVVDHAGVYIGDGRFLHACKAGVVIGKLADWAFKIEGFYSFNGNGQIHT
jgi:cell wall-associated NlpC family hydrolase